MFLKRLSVVFGAVAVSVLNLGAVAQADEEFVQVGVDKNDVPFMLKTTTMGQKERGFGEVIQIYQVKGNYMDVYMLQPGCADKRLWIVGHRVYVVITGEKIKEEKQDTEIKALGDTPGATAMRYYCTSIHATGW